jgi:hypothetical protein
MADDGRPPLELGGLSIDEIDTLLDDLEPEEHDLSAKRRRAHERIDGLRADVRSRVGGASPMALVRLEIWERRLSAERRALHACLDALYAARDAAGGPPRRRASAPVSSVRVSTLVDPDGGRDGTLSHLPPLERPLDDDRTLGLGTRWLDPPQRLERLDRLEGPEQLPPRP